MFTISISGYKQSKLTEFYHKRFQSVEIDPKFTILDLINYNHTHELNKSPCKAIFEEDFSTTHKIPLML